MALVLRKLDRKASFYIQDWLAADDAQADALGDLKTKGNQLSVWLIDEDRSNLHRVLAALAAGRKYLDKIDYAIVNEETLADLRINVVIEDGKTPDGGANQRWHRDLVSLSARQLVGLAVNMRAQLGRKTKKEVADLIASGLAAGFINRTAIQETLLAELPAL